MALQVLYEAYGPGGTGFICSALTDNLNRCAAQVLTAGPSSYVLLMSSIPCPDVIAQGARGAVNLAEPGRSLLAGRQRSCALRCKRVAGKWRTPAA